jgi:sulfopyruvate decarboxylase TPP-binding subunit
MDVEQARLVAAGLREAGFDFIVTLPATQLHALQVLVRDDPAFRHVGVTNEAEGVSICAGAWLGGRLPAIILETSGVLLATYPLMGLHATFGIPTLLLSTYRGDLGEQEWFAVHTGAAFEPLLRALRIPSKVVTELDEVKPALFEARRSMDSGLYPVSVVLGGRLTRAG